MGKTVSTFFYAFFGLNATTFLHNIEGCSSLDAKISCKLLRQSIRFVQLQTRETNECRDNLAAMPSTHKKDKPWDTDDIDKWKVGHYIDLQPVSDITNSRLDRRVHTRGQ